MDAVKQREESYQKVGKVPILKYIGNPTFLPLSEISDGQLLPEIERTLNLLEEKWIIISRPEGMNDRGFYKFLLDDFLPHEISAYHEEGLMQPFSYHDFRHDHPDFIKSHVQELIEEIIDLRKPFEGIWLSETCRDAKNAISKATVIARVNAFRARYQEIIPIAFSTFKHFHAPDGTMYQEIGVAWKGIPANGNDPEEHDGHGICQVTFEDGEWLVQGVMMAGFEF